MQIISHRGYWVVEEEKNTTTAFYRSFSNGFGTETDLRDQNGDIVISHDMPRGESVLLNTFLKLYIETNTNNLPLALNIKADGIQKELIKCLNYFSVHNYFVFDMSVPDGLICLKYGLNVFTRQSEYEIVPSFYDQAIGVWLDAFESTWFTPSLILSHIGNGKQVAIVSPELHKRDKLPLWILLKEHNIHNNDKVILCTDFPEEAMDFFTI